MAEKILVIDDEETTVQLIAILLERRGYEVIKAYRADEGLRKAYRNQPELVLLDIMMPDMDGWDVCKRLREMSDVPIIFLTARGETRDVVRGLEMGADDYVIKPYDNDELVARVRAHLRRSPRPSMSEELVFNNGEFRINFMNREVRVRSEVKHLTPKEFNLLGRHAQRTGHRSLGRRIRRRHRQPQAVHPLPAAEAGERPQPPRIHPHPAWSRLPLYRPLVISEATLTGASCCTDVRGSGRLGVVVS